MTRWAQYFSLAVLGFVALGAVGVGFGHLVNTFPQESEIVLATLMTAAAIIMLSANIADVLTKKRKP